MGNRAILFTPRNYATRTSEDFRAPGPHSLPLPGPHERRRLQIEVDANTVRACIEAVEGAIYPGFQELILNAKGELHLFSKLFLNGELLDRDALDTPVSGDDIVAVLAPAAGG